MFKMAALGTAVGRDLCFPGPCRFVLAWSSDAFWQLLMLVLLCLPLGVSAAQDVFKIPLNSGKVIVDRSKISCNPLSTTKIGFTAWGQWTFGQDDAALNCGRGKRVDHFRIVTRRSMSFSQVLLKSKGKHIKTVGRISYYQYPVAGNMVDELVAFVGADGNQVVITRPKVGSSGYIAHRQIGERVDLSYGARRTDRDDSLLWENDRKILGFVKSIVKIEKE